METFQNFIGQTKVVENLLSQIQNNKLSHAHMFVAPHGQGKATLARIFAAALLCNDPEKDRGPCGVCSSCQKNQKEIHPDLVSIGDEQKKLKIEEIRQLRQTFNYKPTDSSRKVYLLNNAENMTRESANSLLKILEDPPEYVVFIMTVADYERMLPTVVSRCQVYHFTPLTETQMRSALEQIANFTGEQLEAAVTLSGGMIGRGISILSDEHYEELVSKARELCKCITNISIPEMLDWAEEIYKSSDAQEFLELLNILFRQQFIRGNGEITREQLTSIMEIIIKTKGQLLTNANQLLALESMMVEIKEVTDSGI